MKSRKLNLAGVGRWMLRAVCLGLLPLWMAAGGCAGGQKAVEPDAAAREAEAAESEVRPDAPEKSETKAREPKGLKPVEAARGLFVTRWDARSTEDVRRVVEQAKAAGFTDLYWQVRGQCDAYYAGAIEPWGEEIAGDGQGPGFDPLAEATAAAHEKGMRLSAWVNTLTLWHGAAAPANPEHPRSLHPDWVLRGADGEPMRTRDGYELLNPVLPEVRAHLDAVTADICSRYSIDGVCFDVVRLPPGTAVPGDAASRRLFAQENADALGAGADRARVSGEWMMAKVTTLAAGLARTAREQRPGIAVSFVTIAGTPAAARLQLQDAAGWARAGIADVLIVLAASESPTAAVDVERAWKDAEGDGKYGPRVMAAVLPVAASDPAVLGEQLKSVGKSGSVAVFGYSALFESVDGAVPRDVRSTALRTARREAVTKVLGPKVIKPVEEATLTGTKGAPKPKQKDAGKAKGKASPEPAEGKDPAEEPKPEESPDTKPAEDAAPKPDDSEEQRDQQQQQEQQQQQQEQQQERDPKAAAVAMRVTR